MQASLHRHYRLQNLNFRDFWDICSHYQKIHPRYRHILYSVDGFGLSVCQNEGDIGKVLAAIAEAKNQVRRFEARYYLFPHSEPGDYGNAKIVFLPQTADFLDPGLHFFAESDDKLLLYHFEDFIYSGYTMEEEAGIDIEYGLPCEVLCAVIDMRGFTAFCEQPHIESPYTCGLMTAFYHMIRSGFRRYPPDLVKFLGDGVLAVWQTTAKDRAVATDVCVEGLQLLPRTWKQIIKGPEFSHGAPEGLGSGISFGLASKITIDNDYIGRPINVASRLCAVCPPSKTFVAETVPGVGGYNVKRATVRVKTFGDQRVWVLENDI